MIPALMHLKREQGLTSRRLVETKLGLDANNELDAIKAFLQGAQADGRAQAAISSAFTVNNQSAAAKKLDAFVSGKESPLIRWASFDDSKVQGAFIAETNTILISEELQLKQQGAQAVCLRRSGHWLESDLQTNSVGDEGDVFNNNLLSTDEKSTNENDHAILKIGGREFVAELSVNTNGADSGTPDAAMLNTKAENSGLTSLVAIWTILTDLLKNIIPSSANWPSTNLMISPATQYPMPLKKSKTSIQMYSN